MSHKSRRAPLIECPLASLGHNGHHTQNTHQQYHHPLSTSPLNPDVYQMSRTSPILNIGIGYSSGSGGGGGINGHSANGPDTDDDDDVVDDGGQPATNSANSESSASHHVYSNQSSFARSTAAAKTKNIGSKSSASAYRSLPCNYNADDSDSVSCGQRSGGRVAGSIHDNGRSPTYRLSGRDQNSSSRAASVHDNEQYFLEEKVRKFYIQDDSDFKGRQYGSERYYLEDNFDSRTESASPNFLRRPSSPSETSGSDRCFGRISRESPAPPLNGNARRAYNFLVNHHRTHPGSLMMDGLSRLGRLSPNLDQGYHTLASTSQSAANESRMAAMLRNRMRADTPFNKLPDEICVKIFAWADSCDLCTISKVCKRFDALVWTPSLWKTIKLKGEYIVGDRALRSILRRLSMHTRNVACPEVERVLLSEGCRITDKGMELLTRRCPELTHLQIQMSFNITNNALFNLVTKCTNLQHLDVSACSQIAAIDFNQSLDPPRRLLLQFLDLTDCCLLDDVGLKTVVQNCPQLVYLYLRRCSLISDVGLKFVPSYCAALRELSVSDCANITDFGLYELAKLGATLRYLSVAKCDQVSDAGLKVIARRCYKLRYLNARGCEAVSDDSITVLAHSCPRLRALDIGKCDVSDFGLQALAESCPNLKKLSLKNCDMITDRGVQCIAYYCRGLQNLNIQDCQVTVEGYRAVKKYCRRAIIEHTNPGFC